MLEKLLKISLSLIILFAILFLFGVAAMVISLLMIVFFFWRMFKSSSIPSASEGYEQESAGDFYKSSYDRYHKDDNRVIDAEYEDIDDSTNKEKTKK